MISSPQLPCGEVFARDYRVLRPLAEGGMGAVYVVEQLSTGRERALKLMHPQYVADPRLRERFAQEARVGAKVRSEHLVDVLSAGVDDATGMPWLVMELLEGQDLATMVEQRGRLAPEAVVEVYRQLAHAMGAAHRAGLVHRDLKPENIFMAREARSGGSFTVKVLDFGLAKVIQESRTAALNSQAMGSPLWMAPEQLSSEAPISPGTDLWALGLIAFHLLTGRFYWPSANRDDGGLHEIVLEIIDSKLEPASVRAAQLGVPGVLTPAFDAWFARCVVRDPAQRFATADALLEALVQALTGSATPSLRPPATAPAPSFRPPAAPAMPVTQASLPDTLVSMPSLPVIAGSAPAVTATPPVPVASAPVPAPPSVLAMPALAQPLVPVAPVVPAAPAKKTSPLLAVTILLALGTLLIALGCACVLVRYLR